MRHLFLIPLREAETIEIDEKAPQEARTAAQALDGVLAQEKLPKGLRASLAAARANLRKRLSLWSDLQGEDEPDEGEGDPPPPPSAKATEAEAVEFEGLPLVEGKPRGEGEFDVRIIRPGWGSSGYYPPATLQAAAEARIFPRGLKAYWNHPTKQEERDRPERDLRDLAGELTEDARWDPQGPEGPGLYSRVKTFGSFTSAVKELAPHIGLSIRATGSGREAVQEGKKGRVIEAILGAKSVDFVTAPGAGGQVVSLFEAARDHSSHQEDESMELKEALEAKDTAEKRVAELEEARRADQAELTRLREAQTITQAATVIQGKLAQVKLPDLAKARLTESVALGATLKDGKLDEEALVARLDEAVKAETAYLEGVLGKGRITGMGGDNGGGGAEGAAAIAEAEKSLAEGFAAFGLSESAAKLAASGRGR